MYGPHTCALYARAASLANSLRALTHHFLQVDKVAYKLNPGGAGYELTYGVAGVLPYIQSLSPIGDIDDAFSRIAAHEQTLLAPLIGYLRSPQAVSRGVRIVGSDEITLSRVPTVSFVVIGERPLNVTPQITYVRPRWWCIYLSLQWYPKHLIWRFVIDCWLCACVKTE